MPGLCPLMIPAHSWASHQACHLPFHVGLCRSEPGDGVESGQVPQGRGSQAGIVGGGELAPGQGHKFPVPSIPINAPALVEKTQVVKTGWSDLIPLFWTSLSGLHGQDIPLKLSHILDQPQGVSLWSGFCIIDAELGPFMASVRGTETRV